MSATELESLVALFSQLAGGAMYAFIGWLVAQIAQTAITGGTFITIVWLVVRLIRAYSENERWAKDVCDIVGVDHDDYILPRHQRAALNKIREKFKQ